MMSKEQPAQLVTDFKQAMRRLTASIVIVTGEDEGTRFGMAATACMSVAVDPPSLCICVNRSASLHQPITKGRRFAVNLLGAGHEDIVGPFSTSARRDERFAEPSWSSFDCGVPLLADAVMAILAEVDVDVEYGSHSLFIGRVLDVRLGDTVDPLLWHDGRFVRAMAQGSGPSA